MTDNETLPQNKIANLFGFYSAAALAVITIISFALGIMAVPISGANAPGGGLPYPYLDTLQQFPKDYFWMIGAMLLLLTYVVLMVSINSIVDTGKKLISQLGVLFSVMAAVILLLNYFIQISVVPVSLANNETAGITLITQYNPHGIFIAAEELGYILMSISFLFAAVVFSGKNRLEAWIRWIFVVSFVLTILSFLGIMALFGIERQDRFEVIVISINWLVLIINGTLLGIFFKKRQTNARRG
jgi:hypothetical protein